MNSIRLRSAGWLFIMIAMVAAGLVRASDKPAIEFLTIPLTSVVEWDEGVEYNSITPGLLAEAKTYGYLRVPLPEGWAEGEPVMVTVKSSRMGPSPFDESVEYAVRTVVTDRQETLLLYLVQGPQQRAIHDLVRHGYGFPLIEKRGALLTETWKRKTDRSKGVLKLFAHGEKYIARAAIDLKVLTVLVSGRTDSRDWTTQLLEFAQGIHVSQTP